jgi:hypothetical protein
LDSEDGNYLGVPTPTINDLRNWAWRNGALEWKLHAAQLIIHNQIEALPVDAKDVVLLCSRRFGKSYYGCARALMSSAKSRNKRRLTRIIGPDIKQTEMIVEHHMAKLTEELNTIGLRDFVEHIKSDKMYRVGKAGIFLGGYDSQKDSLRGGEADEILIEESGQADPDQYIYQMKSVLKPQLLKTRGRMIHLTTPPKLEDHPFVIDTIPAAELAGAFRKFTIYDDPLATPEIIEDAIKDSGGVHTRDFRREYLVEIIRDPSIVVVPDYDDTRHVTHVAFPMEFFPHTTIDFGGVRDKTAALLHWYNFFDDVTEVWDERVFEPNTPTGTIVKEILEMEKSLPPGVQVRRYADMPGQLQIDLNHHHKFECSVVGKDDWQSSINNLAVKFSVNKIRIHKRCAFLRQSLKSGTFNKQRNDFARSQALGHCDAIAALMYGVRMETKQNPYGQNHLSRDTHFYIPKPTPETEVATAIQPKQFANSFEGVFVPKKFGTFRR